MLSGNVRNKLNILIEEHFEFNLIKYVGGLIFKRWQCVLTDILDACV